MRKNFNKAITDQRVAKALQHKVRSVEIHFKEGERVYYKRDGLNQWLGPATVIGGRPMGSTYVIEHQGSIYRVSSNRLKNVEKAENFSDEVPTKTDAQLKKSSDNPEGDQRTLTGSLREGNCYINGPSGDARKKS